MIIKVIRQKEEAEVVVEVEIVENKFFHLLI
jgi:hypothetical protein